MEYINLEFLIKGLLIAWMWVNFSPLQTWLGRWVKPRIPNKLSYINTAMSCVKCMSFWVVLGMSFSLYAAILAAVIAYTYEKVMGSFKMRL